MLGTLGYMSPEQLRGAHSTLDARADVYSLGGVLFEVLTLEPLHRGATVGKPVLATLGDEDRSPARRAPDREIPPELDALCERATAPDREQRFPSARALSEALALFLEGDRDRALRRKRADDLAERARASLADGELEHRVRAGREAAQALAFDPEHTEARATLLTVLTERPGTPPAEVSASVERERALTEVQSWRTAAIGALAFKVLLLELLFAIGVWDVPLAVLATGMGVAGVFCLLAAARRGPAGSGLALAGFALSCVENALFMRWTSPLISIPALMFSLVIALAIWAPPRGRWLRVAMAAASARRVAARA